MLQGSRRFGTDPETCTLPAYPTLNPRPQHPIGAGELGLGGVARADLDWKVEAWLPQLPRT